MTGRKTAQDKGKLPENLAHQDEAAAEDWAGALPHFSTARESLVPPRKRRWRLRLRWVFLCCLVITLLGSGFLALSGRGIALPQWAIMQLEQRLNETIAANHLPEGTRLTLGGLEVALDRDFEPRFILRDLQIEQMDAAAKIALPQTQVTLSGKALLRATIKPKSVILSGAQLAVTRDLEGKFRFDLGGLSGQNEVQSVDQFLDSVDRMFSSPMFEDLARVEGQALGLRLHDLRAGRDWSFGDGRMLLDNRPESVAIELGLTLLSAAAPAQASLGAVSSKVDRSARLWANIEQIAAADLAVQAAPFAILGMVDAPISGQITAELDEKGVLGAFEGRLNLGAGEVEAVGGGRSVPFEQADVALRYDIASQRVSLDELSVQSPSLRLSAQGWGDLLDAKAAPMPKGALPQVIVSQLKFSQVMVDPEGLFVEPLAFSSGLADFRISLQPFRIDIGEVSLREGKDVLRLWGHMGQAEPQGWQGALDVSVNHMDSNRLLRLWPLIAVPKTRHWLEQNVGQAVLSGVNAALRFGPDHEPRFALDYDFKEAEVRFLRTLPPITQGSGHASISGNVYTMVVDRGHVAAPQGGDVRVDGSMFQVLDILQKPAQAEVTLLSKSSISAVLSLLDQEPFRILSKAKLPIDLARGEADLTTILRFPLVAKIQRDQISYSVKGRLTSVSSETLVKGRKLAADSLDVEVNPRLLRISGSAEVDSVAFKGKFEQSLVKGEGGKARVEAKLQLDDAALRRFGVALPQTWLGGKAEADIGLALKSGQTPRLSVKSDLKGLSLAAFGWSKSGAQGGKLEADVSLSPAPVVHSLQLQAGDLSLAASAKTSVTQGLETMVIDRLRVGDWLDLRLELTGRGKGQRPSVKVVGGRLDLRRLPKQTAGAASDASAEEIAVTLERGAITDKLALTGLSGRITPRGSGVSGKFTAGLNGIGQLEGVMEPRNGGTAVQIRSRDAGTVMAAAGIFNKGRGGSLDMTIQPEGQGVFLGNAKFSNFSVQNAPSLAAMLSAASVVGLLDQLQGQGIYFDEGDLAFRIRPQGIEIINGSAHGASMGISFAGLYQQRNHWIDIQGTISPIYLLNGLGQIFTGKGEGLFGFNYRLSGPAGNPSVTVNPLSILTPGRFREIFRRPAPVFERAR